MKGLLIFLLMVPLLAVALEQPLSDLSGIVRQQRGIREAVLAGDAKQAPYKLAVQAWLAGPTKRVSCARLIGGRYD
jgi:hypothetical protein